MERLVVRIGKNTLRRMRKQFPAKEGESMFNYFRRLTRALENGEV